MFKLYSQFFVKVNMLLFAVRIVSTLSLKVMCCISAGRIASILRLKAIL